MPARLFSLAVLAALCACATPSSAEREGGAGAVTVEQLKAIQPSSPQTAVVVLFRNTAFGGLMGPMGYKGSLFVDEVPVGDLMDDTYATVELNPGRHSLRVLGTVAGVAMQSATVIALSAGKVEFVELTTDQGFSAQGVSLKRSPAPPLAAIARDCRPSFQIDLAGEAAKKPAAPVNTM
jgi:hypothetical protein